MKLKELEITKFRGIQHLHIDELGKVNVFIGSNNVGKSTLLEATFMLASMANPLLPSQVNVLREAQRADLAHIKYLFYKAKISDHPIIEGITLENLHKRVEITTIGAKASNKDENIIDLSATDSTPINGIELICDDGAQQYTTKLTNDNGKLSITSTIQYIDGRFRSVLISSNSKEGNVLESYSELVRRQLKDAIIKALRNFDARITNIEALSDGLYLQFEGMDELLPLTMAGDGVRRYLGIVSHVIDPTTDIVLIDEIENGLHYTAYSKLWESLILSALSNNVQLFVTTHSKETLRCLAETYTKLQDKLNSNDVRIYTIDQELNGEQHVYALSAEGLQGAIESNIEIRK